MWFYRHRLAWDLSGIADKGHRATVQGALNACSFPFSRIRKRTGKRVPVTVSDLSRYEEALAAAKGGHVHVHDAEGNEAHLLGAPRGSEGALQLPDDHPEKPRAAALGLFWLPTAKDPAGRVELDRGAMSNKPLAQEVFIAEAAHAVDYGAMTDGQRAQVVGLFDYRGTSPQPKGWFEEQGEEDYWRWRGERWMGLFMATYAAGLPRPLEPRQPWQWSYDASDVAAVKRILR
jgi:hypothetical protein